MVLHTGTPSARSAGDAVKRGDSARLPVERAR